MILHPFLYVAQAISHPYTVVVSVIAGIVLLKVTFKIAYLRSIAVTLLFSLTSWTLGSLLSIWIFEGFLEEICIGPWRYGGILLLLFINTVLEYPWLYLTRVEQRIKAKVGLLLMLNFLEYLIVVLDFKINPIDL